MSFLWPELLLTLAALPALVFAYRRWLERGMAEAHGKHTDLEFIAVAARQGSRWREHLGALLFLGGIGFGLVSLARPQTFVPTPDPKAGVMLVIDVSRSMRADDVKPSRMEAAKTAAKRFIERLPDVTKAGLVTFAGYAMLNSPLTVKHELLLEQIEGIEMQRGTAIGEGLLEAAKAFPQKDGKVSIPAVVILLSDGRNTTGTLPADAALEAKKLGLRVHTIGVGDPNATTMTFGRMGQFNEAELRGIAEATGGRYHAVTSAEELERVYRDLGREIGWRWLRSEASAIPALIAAVCLMLSLAASSRRFL